MFLWASVCVVYVKGRQNLKSKSKLLIMNNKLFHTLQGSIFMEAHCIVMPRTSKMSFIWDFLLNCAHLVIWFSAMNLSFPKCEESCVCMCLRGMMIKQHNTYLTWIISVICAWPSSAQKKPHGRAIEDLKVVLTCDLEKLRKVQLHANLLWRVGETTRRQPSPN